MTNSNTVKRVDVAKLTKRHDAMQQAIDEFCRKSEWSNESWRAQPHIAALFALKSVDI